MALPAKETVSPLSFHDILVPVRDEVARIETVLTELLHSEVPLVNSVATYIINNGGKRLRPILTVLIAKMAGFKTLSAYKLGACVEFIHTASLLHDDVIDNAKVRRGRLSANAKWGNHVSVLVGDFFYCRASQLLTEHGDLRILKLVTDCITALTEGEVLEIITSSERKTTRADYVSIIEKKTALLFSAACRIGAILGGMAAEYEKALKNYGHDLGMAFQLADDVIDYTSSEDIMGKAKGLDLQEGKLTLPLIIALSSATEDERKFIYNALLGDRLEPDIFLQIQGIIKKYRGFDQTYALARDHVDRAKGHISLFRESIEKDILLSLADYVINRDS